MSAAMKPGGASHVLVVDDDLSMREFLGILLRREGYSVELVDSGEAALQAVAHAWPDLVLSDLNMPGIDGMELLRRLKTQAARESRDLEVVMVTAFGTAESAVEAMRRGAFDYVLKPFNNDDLRVTVRRALEKASLEAENARLKAEVRDELHFGCFIGSSPAMQRVYELIRRIKDTPINCLVLGESGTGKELVARSLHEAGVRSGPFVAINCGAIPENLVESELFGHVRGAFTGADRERKGHIVQANGGTLFLDELNSLPQSAQVKLLRVLQDRRVLPVGASREVNVDVRIIAASNGDLAQLTRTGQFREDLYYRINVIQVSLPPLRERPGDVDELVRHFVKKYAREYGTSVDRASQPALQALRAWNWPGNVRELQNTIARAVVLAEGTELLLGDLPEMLRGGFRSEAPTVRIQAVQLDAADTEVIPPEGVDLDQLLADVERKWLVAALKSANGNKTRAARALRMSFRSFRYRLAKYDLDH